MPLLPPVPLWIWQEWVRIVYFILQLFILLYFPIALTSIALIIRWLLNPSRRVRPPPVKGRKIAAVICTNGKAASLVDKLIGTMQGYGLPDVEFYVIKEAYDSHAYPATQIVVPESYRAPNGSVRKERALHYSSEWARGQGWGRETYILHLDDDSVVEREYMLYVLGMRSSAGQGAIRLREHGRHLLSTLADLIRVADCETLCRFFNERGQPKAVHGEGLAIRADIEERIGWDYGTYGGEDFIMGQEIIALGETFEHIPYNFYVASPVKVRDFLKQRRRWTYSTLSTRKRVMAMAPLTFIWIVYRYAVAWTGFAGFFVFVYAVTAHLLLSNWIAAVGLFNTVVYFASYQVSAAHVDRRYMPIALATQFAVALYEGICLPYSVIWPPARGSFDTITKV